MLYLTTGVGDNILYLTTTVGDNMLYLSLGTEGFIRKITFIIDKSRQDKYAHFSFIIVLCNLALKAKVEVSKMEARFSFNGHLGTLSATSQRKIGPLGLHETKSTFIRKIRKTVLEALRPLGHQTYSLLVR